MAKRRTYKRDRIGRFAEVLGVGTKKKKFTTGKSKATGKKVQLAPGTTQKDLDKFEAARALAKLKRGKKKPKKKPVTKKIGNYKPIKAGKDGIREEAVEVKISKVPKPLRLRIENVVEAGVQRAIDDGRDTHALFDKLPSPKDRPDLAWNEERQSQHKALLDDVYARSKNVPTDKQIIMSGGLPGAGKTHTLEKNMGIPETDYVVINPDKMKEELFERGMIPRDYETEYGLSPGEAATLVHEESSFLAKQLFDRALADNKNIIFDTTMNSTGSVAKVFDKLKAADYPKPRVAFVDVSVEVSKKRAQERYVRAATSWLKNHQGFGGRYVPPSVSGNQTDSTWGSKNRAAFEEVKAELPDWIVIDHNEFGNPFVVEQAPGSQFKFAG